MSALPFRADVQGLRAVAVTAVVLAHFGVPGFAGGFVGVDVFFVISGYLITGLLWRELVAEDRIRLGRFYARRLRRLMPALVTMIGVSGAAALWLLSGWEIRQQTGSAPFALTWTSNLYFAFRAQDYFAWLQSRDLYLHTWSLGVEEQFYLLWPLLLWALFRGVRSRSGRLAVLVLVAVAGLVACVAVSYRQALLAFYLPLFRIWEFALGALVFLAGEAFLSRAPQWRTGVAWLGLAAVAAAVFLFRRQMLYPGFWAAVPALGTALVLAGTAGRVLANPVLVWLGDRSYSLYLWHWPVWVLGAAWGMDRFPRDKMGLALGALLLTVLSYRLVEYPFWKGRFSRFGSPRHVFAGAVTVMMVGALSAFVVGGLVGAVKSRAEAVLMAARTDLPPLYRAGCDRWYRDDVLQPCAMGDADGTTTVALIGDSIGAQWASLLPAAFPDARIVILTKSSCPMVDEPYFYERIGRVYRVCERWREKALSYLESLHPDVVFVGSAATYPYSRTQWIEGSRRVLTRLSRAAGRVLVIAGTPQLGMDGPGCLAKIRNRLHLADRFCSRRLPKTSRIATVNGWLKDAAATVPNAAVLDFSPWVCPEGWCRALVNGVVAFRDGQHLTDSFVRRLAAAGLAEAVRRFTPDTGAPVAAR